MTWFDAVLFVILGIIVMYEVRIEASRGLWDAIAAVMAMKIGGILAPMLTSSAHWQPGPGGGPAPTALGLCFGIALVATVVIGRLVSSQWRWSLDALDPMCGFVFGIAIAVTLGHVVTTVAAMASAVHGHPLPDYLKHSLLVQELRSFRTYHMVLDQFHSFQNGGT